MVCAKSGEVGGRRKRRRAGGRDPVLCSLPLFLPSESHLAFSQMWDKERGTATPTAETGYEQQTTSRSLIKLCTTQSDLVEMMAPAVTVCKCSSRSRRMLPRSDENENKPEAPVIPVSRVVTGPGRGFRAAIREDPLAGQGFSRKAALICTLKHGDFHL